MQTTQDPLVKRLLKNKTTVRVSEFAELVSSLHVLHRPEHHTYRLEWVKTLNEELPASLREKLEELGRLSTEWLALLGFVSGDDSKMSTKDGLAQLERVPDAEFLVLLFNQRFSLETIMRWMLGLDRQERESQLSEAERQAFTHPDQVRQKLVAVLRSYDRGFFQAEWQRIEPWLVRAERTFYDKLARDPVKTVAALHPRLSVCDDAIYAQKAIIYRVPYGEIKQIVVRPSTFIYPHLLFGWCDGVASLPLSVQVPYLSRNDDAPADLVHMFRVLSDATRLKIVRSLYLKPHCTQQLAHTHGISEAAVSKHLKLLVKADFVTTERQGHYLFYALRPEKVEMMLVYLRQYLEQ